MESRSLPLVSWYLYVNDKGTSLFDILMSRVDQSTREGSGFRQSLGGMWRHIEGGRGYEAHGRSV